MFDGLQELLDSLKSLGEFSDYKNVVAGRKLLQQLKGTAQGLRKQITSEFKEKRDKSKKVLPEKTGIDS